MSISENFHSYFFLLIINVSYFNIIADTTNPDKYLSVKNFFFKFFIVGENKNSAKISASLRQNSDTHICPQSAVRLHGNVMANSP